MVDLVPTRLLPVFFPSCRHKPPPMDTLPPHLLLEILTKLDNTTDVTRCKLVSRTFNSLTRHLNFVNLQCSLSRYLNSRSPAPPRTHTTPFKFIVLSVIRAHPNIESVSIGVGKSLMEVADDDVEDYFDDLFLSDEEFVKQWLAGGLSDGLKSISITDFWIQSCWRKSHVLKLISSCCHKLVELEIKNAWLKADGISPMATLRSLTLEYVRLDDENLDKMNAGFPALQVLNLMGVGGLKNPKIQLLHLRTCRWTVSNAPDSLAIIAPSLTKLELNCSSPKMLVIKAPLLSEFNLSIERVGKLSVEALPNAKTFQVATADLGSIINSLPCETVEYLAVDLLKREVEVTWLDPRWLLNAFPNLTLLAVGPEAWFAFETWHETSAPSHPSYTFSNIETRNVTQLAPRVVVRDAETTYALISCVLSGCANLSKVSLLVHRSIDPAISLDLIARCIVNYPKVQWKWGTWKEEEQDVWVSSVM